MCGFAADFNVLIDCKVRSDSGLEQRYGVAVLKSVGVSLFGRSFAERT